MISLFALTIVFMGITSQVCGLVSNTVVFEEQLEDILCGDNFTDATELIELLPSKVYTIPHGNFCVINTISNLTIKSNDSSSPAVIQCLRGEQSSVLSRGFAFINVSRLTIANVTFENCGTIMTEEVLGRGNISRFSSVYFGQGEAAALVCNNCSGLILSHVQIKTYTGHAFVGIDVFGSSLLESVVVSDNRNVHRNCRAAFNTCKGSGIVWMYTNTTGQERTNVTVKHSTFSDNVGDLIDDFKGCADTLADSFYSRNTSFNPVMLPSVGAMTLIHQQKSIVQFNIVNTNFTRNRGQCYGAILAVYVSESAYSSTRFSGCTFNHNGHVVVSNSSSLRGRRYFGSLLTLFLKYLGNYTRNDDCLFIENSQFEEADSPSQISLTTFPSSLGFCLAKLQNVVGGNSRLMYVSNLDATDSLQVYLSNVSLFGKHFYDSLKSGVGYGLLSFSFLNNVVINGSHFRNLNGPVIYAEATNVIFVGNLTFNNAIGSLWSGGAVMYLREGSLIWFMEPLNMFLSNNTAFQGGAVFSLDPYSEYCAVQFVTEEAYDDSNIGDIRINVIFADNRARVAGNSMYIAPLTSCSLRLSNTIEVNTTIVYDQVFKFLYPEDNGLLEISSTPMQVCMCGSDTYDTNITALTCAGDNRSLPTIRTFPGKTFNLSIVALDERLKRVFSLIYISPQPANDLKFDWRLGYGEGNVQADGLNCTRLTFSIFSSSVDHEVRGQLVMYPSDSTTGLFFPVVLTNCPLGFELVSNTDSCGCLEFLTKKNIGIQCDTSTGQISRPGTSWIGIASRNIISHSRSTLNAGDVLVGYSQYCPTRYCDQTLSSVNVNDSEICLHGRTGILCGQCKEGLSVTIGSPACLKCSNWWLFMIPVYALFGIIIVAVLVVLQLTVAQGTINGLVFYANILSISAYYLLGREGSQWALIFISFINLEFGFAVCLYDGLDDITKGILSIVFPLYIWMVAILFVYISRHSSRFSKLTSQSAVSVLATLIYITYYELLRFSVDGLAYGTIDIQPNETSSTKAVVWYYDGNIRYLQLEDHKHIGLFFMVLVVVFVFIIPFGVILTGIRFFSRFRIVNKFKPLIDAYCAPFKDRYRFWFGLRLWILDTIYVLFAIVQNTPQLLYLFQSIILILFIMAQVAVMPFKNVFINWLDLSFMVNALLLTLVALLNDQLGIHIASIISVAVAMVVFFCIVIYHSWKLWKRIKLIYKRWKVNKYSDVYDKNNEPNENVITSSSLVISTSTEDINYRKFVNVNPPGYRDSILDDSMDDID